MGTEFGDRERKLNGIIDFSTKHTGNVPHRMQLYTPIPFIHSHKELLIFLELYIVYIRGV